MTAGLVTRWGVHALTQFNTPQASAYHKQHTQPVWYTTYRRSTKTLVSCSEHE